MQGHKALEDIALWQVPRDCSVSSYHSTVIALVPGVGAGAPCRTPVEEFSSLTPSLAEAKWRWRGGHTPAQQQTHSSALCPALKTLCGIDDKRSFAKLIVGKFQPLSIFKRPFIICLFKAIWEKSSKFCSWREAARTAIKSQAVQWHMDCEGLRGYDDLSHL